MKIAVLGAKGFLGSYLVGSLVHNHHVVPVTRDTLSLESYQAVDKWLTEVKPDVIVNCAMSASGNKVNDINYSDVQRDYAIFLNFYNNPKTPKYINIGSGAEFDRRSNIANCQEQDILYAKPLESYGYTKNIIARSVLNRDNFYTLRLFGCFDGTELSTRLFAKFFAQKKIEVQDRYFDYISASDFARVVEYVAVNQVSVKDINCVYPDKRLLSDQLKMFAQYHIPSADIKHSHEINAAYTGDGNVLKNLGIPLQGLEQGIKDYFKDE